MKTPHPSKTTRLLARNGWVILPVPAAIGIALSAIASTNCREQCNGHSSLHLIFGEEPGPRADSDTGAHAPEDDLRQTSQSAYCSYRVTPFELFRNMEQGTNDAQPDLPTGLDPRFELHGTEDSDPVADVAPDLSPRADAIRNRSLGPWQIWRPNSGPVRSAILSDKRPKTTLFGAGGESASRVVFVCDVSGSMLNKGVTLMVQLENAVNRLNRSQLFNIVLLQDQGCHALDGKTLLAANSATKQAAGRFMDQFSLTKTVNPIPSIKFAFGLHPDVIYLITDSDFVDNKQVLAGVRRSYQSWHAKVNTIALVGDSDTDTEFIDLLKRIAAETGGVYRLVHVSDLEP